MTERAPMQVPQKAADVYASREEFHAIFNEDLKQLYHLSFLLTRDTAKAERCLVLGLEECVEENFSFRVRDHAVKLSHLIECDIWHEPCLLHG